MVHIARCLLGDPELMAAQDICHWMSDDDFDLCFKVGDNFDVLKPVPANLHVNRSAAVQALDQLSTAPGSRILSHGQNVYEISLIEV
uniref:Uncharacterized protein n=1 Tax=Ditylenchus dipsaci TaxID=166011 RepID=A0A915EKT6_9BILA